MWNYQLRIGLLIVCYAFCHGSLNEYEWMNEWMNYVDIVHNYFRAKPIQLIKVWDNKSLMIYTVQAQADGWSEETLRWRQVRRTEWPELWVKWRSTAASLHVDSRQSQWYAVTNSCDIYFQYFIIFCTYIASEISAVMPVCEIWG